MSTRKRVRQRGVALITAMFVVALATIAAVAMFESSNIAVRRASNLVESETALWYAVGVESWTKGILKQDAKNNDTDSLADIWARPVDFLPIDNGSLRGRVEDLQGRFNLNNLATTDLNQLKIYLLQFQLLLDAVGGEDAAKATGVGAAIRDWVDADSERIDLNGAEDNEYQGLDPPYRAANRPMQSVSELLQVRGVTKGLYAALRPYVAALPTVGTRINVNTAPPQVLAALSKTVDRSALAKFVQARTGAPVKTAQEVLNGGANSFLGADNDLKPETQIDVRSRYFGLTAEVFIGSGRVALYSVYIRPEGGADPIVITHATDAD
ncbi:MAG: general secretion pathway protein GspK [Xanthomonadaceae bacterium]|nr:general secretion pathway protein GspK [Xanthomonadaceae bacterium]